MSSNMQKQNQEQDIILQHQKRRRKRKIKLAIESIVVIIIAVAIIATYFLLTKNEYNKYTEKAKVDYKVNLKENEFYENDYVEDKTSAVACLINNIEAEFKYSLDLELVKKSEYENITYVLVIGSILLVVGILIFIKLIKYLLDTRSAETMYDQEMRRILFNYKSYIQKTNNEIDFKNYKVIQIDTFNEILGMRDTVQAPILMYTEDNEDRTKFMIIKDDVLYVNVLGAKEIRNELRAKSAKKKAKESEKSK